jgi:hypothetical protein
VLAALARFEVELADTALSRRQRRIALRFVVHFVVDIHQPLHVGRASDRGGNLVPVLVNGRETDLHALWDGEPLRPPGGPSPREKARRLPPPAASAVLRWQRTNPVAWAEESQALRPAVYAFGGRAGEVVALPPDYLERARAIVDQRLLQAGVRLAGRLNAAFGAAPAAGCGAQVASQGSTL